MKKILFDFLPFEDSYVNGGALYTRTILLRLLKENICLSGICKNVNNLSLEIKEIIEKYQNYV